MSKKILLIWILVVILVACSTDQNVTSGKNSGSATEVAKSVQKTVQALDKSDKAKPTIPLPKPTHTLPTAAPTKTMFPTYTPRPKIETMADVTFDPNPKTIYNAIHDPYTEKVFSFPVITVTDVKAYPSSKYGDPVKGETTIQVSVKMKNPGETIAQYGSKLFQAFDSNGIGHEPNYSFDDCELDFDTDVLPGGTLEGCLEFSIPDVNSKFILTYAPYQHDQYSAGRHLSWEIGYPEVTSAQPIEPTIKATTPTSLRTNLTNGWVYTLSSKAVGEFQYIGNKPIGNINLKSVFYNDKGEIKGEADGFSWQECVFPGEKIVFKLSTSGGMKNASKVELTITADYVAQDETQYIYRSFEMNNFQLIPTEDGDYKMAGEVINIGDKTVMGVGVYVIAYDKLGNIVGFDQATAGYETASFEPEQSSPVDGRMRIEHPDGLDAVDHFEFLFEAYAF